jgi:hypothetical protein
MARFSVSGCVLFTVLCRVRLEELATTVALTSTGTSFLSFPP